MNRAIVVGTLIKDPESKVAASGKAYAKGMIRCDSKVLREGDVDHIVVFVTCFGDVADALMAKKKGDAISVAGRLDLRAALWKELPVVNASITADKLIDAARPPRKAKDDTATSAPAPKARSSAPGTLPDVRGEGIADMLDDVAF